MPGYKRGNNWLAYVGGKHPAISLKLEKCLVPILTTDLSYRCRRDSWAGAWAELGGCCYWFGLRDSDHLLHIQKPQPCNGWCCHGTWPFCVM